MRRKTVSHKLFKVLSWRLLATLLLTLGLMLQPSIQTFPAFSDNVIYAQEGEGDDDDGLPGQGLCPDGETAVPGGVDKIQFCRDNSPFPPAPDPDMDMAPETVIPAGLPRTGRAANPIPWGVGSMAAGSLAVLAAVSLWRWRRR